MRLMKAFSLVKIENTVFSYQKRFICPSQKIRLIVRIASFCCSLKEPIRMLIFKLEPAHVISNYLLTEVRIQ